IGLDYCEPSATPHRGPWTVSRKRPLFRGNVAFEQKIAAHASEIGNFFFHGQTAFGQFLDKLILFRFRVALGAKTLHVHHNITIASQTMAEPDMLAGRMGAHKVGEDRKGLRYVEVRYGVRK